MKINVGLMSSWDIKCGIATYSKYLLDELKKHDILNVNIIKNNRKTSNPFYWFKLGFNNRKHHVIHIQHEYGLFGFHGWGYFLFYAGLKTSRHNKVIITVHETHRLKDGFIYNKLMNVFSDKIIIHVENIDYFNAEIIPHGTPRFTHTLNLSQNKTILCPGYINRNKGLERIIKALIEIPNANLIIAGTARTEQDRKYVAKLKKMIYDIGLTRRVSFTGYITDFNKLFSSANIVVFPYQHTTQSGMLAIALSHGANIITSDIPTFKAIKDKYNCIETATTDDDYIEKIKYAFENGNTRLEEIKRYCDLTSWQCVAKQHLELYGDITQWLHTDKIYDAPEQKKRINWLKDHSIGNVLEVGCATGYVLNYIGWGGVGIDIIPERVRYAQKTYPELTFIVASATNLPMTERFDTVILAEILEHVSFDIAKKIVKECFKIGDKLLITVPVGKWAVNSEHLWLPSDSMVRELLNGFNRKTSRDKHFLYYEVTTPEENYLTLA